MQNSQKFIPIRYKHIKRHHYKVYNSTLPIELNQIAIEVENEVRNSLNADDWEFGDNDYDQDSAIESESDKSDSDVDRVRHKGEEQEEEEQDAGNTDNDVDEEEDNEQFIWEAEDGAEDVYEI